MSDRHPLSLQVRIDAVCNPFEDDWKAALNDGENPARRPRIQDRLPPDWTPEEQAALLHCLVPLDLDYRFRCGEVPSIKEYVALFPAHTSLIRDLLDAQPTGSPGGPAPLPTVRSAGAARAAQVTSQPAFLGRYRILRELGRGSFGVVYLGRDDDLKREVAIKVPLSENVAGHGGADAFLKEARDLATLHHPNIVTVFDAGRTEDGLCYIVSEYVPGGDLAKRLRAGRPEFPETARWLTGVADALQHAHSRKLYHRDVKPGNILLDPDGTARLSDFGLALREQEVGQGARILGTPAYMSPEQARGEGHRVDGRSDIFSLGIVLYELLTGERPFTGLLDALLDQILHRETPPPRQKDPAIPAELERICLKATAKLLHERYSNAADMAGDLRNWLDPAGQRPEPLAAAPATQAEPPAVRVIPRGLRAFDAEDAGFFLELLPGLREADGLPQRLHFWKRHAEETRADATFPVGLLFGPSGCGKSSLVKAGLLPRLAGRVAVVYVEATQQQTESRLLAGLRRACPDLDSGLALADTLTALRRGHGLALGRKVFIVLDQFEQWLHAHAQDEDAELVRALRQCDGGRVQAVVLVRDDFLMAAHRFFERLDLPIRGGENATAVDLFEPRHARKVLASFGEALEALPARADARTPEQNAFLDRAVEELAVDGLVIPVRLALFAEMVKGRPRAPATLRELGGVGGVGVAFLEETVSGRSPWPALRLHQEAARSVLRVLLPGQGDDIKGAMRTRDDLLAASGLVRRPAAFDEVVHALDAELRLITPTDPGGRGDSEAGPALEGRFYQLTHDYLVPAVREWLTRKQRETRRGRAELRLAERAALWNRKSEASLLPPWWEWLNIRLWTRKRDWTPPQRRMMGKAGRRDLLRGAGLLLLLAVLGWGAFEGLSYFAAASRVEALASAETAEVPRLVRDLDGHRRWADTLIRRRLATGLQGRERLHLTVALAPVDSGQVDYLLEQLLAAPADTHLVLRAALKPYHDDVADRLWAVLQDNSAEGGRRLRAAAALASYEPDDVRWSGVSTSVVNQLVGENILIVGTWIEALRPVGRDLTPALETVFRDAARSEAERRLATNVLAEYAANRPDVLASLLADAEPWQYRSLFPRLEAVCEQAVARLRAVLGETAAPDGNELPADWRATEVALVPALRTDALAQRQANAAVALVRLNDAGPVWPLFRRSPDPSLRSHLLHRLALLGANPQVLVARLDTETHASARAALVLALGEFSDRDLPPAVREPLVRKLLDWYENHPDPGLHGAIDWLLRHGQEGPQPRPLDWGQKAALERIDARLARQGPDGQRGWYVNREGHTLALVKGPVEARMGSPPWEPNRDSDETPCVRVIPRNFAVATKPVTVAQWHEFVKERPGVWSEDITQYSPGQDTPVVLVTFYQAMQYCNWLSDKEKIPEDQWCYPKEIKEGMKPLSDYLRRTGYRLPTEAECEYACRASTLTSRSYGSSEKLLPRYAWYLDNSQRRAWPVGQKRPNDLGLFDMHGNVWAWCQDPGFAYAEGRRTDVEDTTDISSNHSRILRGGFFSVRRAERALRRPLRHCAGVPRR